MVRPGDWNLSWFNPNLLQGNELVNGLYGLSRVKVEADWKEYMDTLSIFVESNSFARPKQSNYEAITKISEIYATLSNQNVIK